MNLRHDNNGAVFVSTKRHFWIDNSDQPIPEFIKPPCVILQDKGVNFAIELEDIPRLRKLLDEAEQALY